MNLGHPAVHALDELSSFSTSATRVGRPTDGSNWSASGHVFVEYTAVGLSGMRSDQNYSYITGFKTRKGNQDFGSKNISIS